MCGQPPSSQRHVRVIQYLPTPTSPAWLSHQWCTTSVDSRRKHNLLGCACSRHSSFLSTSSTSSLQPHLLPSSLYVFLAQHVVTTPWDLAQEGSTRCSRLWKIITSSSTYLSSITLPLSPSGQAFYTYSCIPSLGDASIPRCKTTCLAHAAIFPPWGTHH